MDTNDDENDPEIGDCITDASEVVAFDGVIDASKMPETCQQWQDTSSKAITVHSLLRVHLHYETRLSHFVKFAPSQNE